MKGFESWMLSYLLNSLWQVPLLFVSGWAAARAFRNISADAEHRVWVAVLLAQSFLPALSTLRWEWLLSIASFYRASSPTGEAQVSVVMGAGTGLGILHLPSVLLAATAIAYAAATFYFAARFGWRWQKLHTIRLRAEELSLAGNAARYWAECSERFDIRTASIAASSLIFSPVTMGLSRKLLLLPTAMVSELAAADMRTVIAHEFAHMRRNDFLKNLVYELLSLPVSSIQSARSHGSTLWRAARWYVTKWPQESTDGSNMRDPYCGLLPCW